MRNKLFKVTSIAAIFAVASANVYIMNDVDLNSNSDLSLLTLENVADAGEVYFGRTSEEMGLAGQEKEKEVYCDECRINFYGCVPGRKNCQPRVCEHLLVKGGQYGFGAR